MFNPAYIIEDAQDEQYISLVRAVLDEKTAGTRVGTLIMSINREAFSGIMTRYAYEGDKVYVCIDEGQVLMDNDSAQEIGDDEIRTLFGQVEGQRSGMLRQDVKGKEYLINYYTLRKPWEFDGQAIRIFHFTDYREIREQVEGITERISAVILLVLLLILLCRTRVGVEAAFSAEGVRLDIRLGWLRLRILPVKAPEEGKASEKKPKKIERPKKVKKKRQKRRNPVKRAFRLRPRISRTRSERYFRH